MTGWNVLLNLIQHPHVILSLTQDLQQIADQARNDEIGVRNDEIGARNDEIGVRNDEKGARNDEKGARNDG